MKVEACDCMLTLGGEIQSIKLKKLGITVPEAAILNAMHGDGAIHSLTNVRVVNIAPVREKARLSAKYRRRAGPESERDLANTLFPGMAPNFPSSFEQIGIIHSGQRTTPATGDEDDTGFATLEPGGNTGGASPIEVDGDDDDDGDDADAAADVEGAVFDAAGNIVPQLHPSAALASSDAPKAEKKAAKGGKAPGPITSGDDKLAALVGA